jgi:hypothetical protein
MRYETNLVTGEVTEHEDAESNYQPPPTTLKDYDIAVEKHLDTVADMAGYYDPLGRIPNIDRACAYAAYDNDYQAESQSFVAWRAAVWKKAYEIQLAVGNGERDQPTIEELISELPVKQ